MIFNFSFFFILINASIFVAIKLDSLTGTIKPFLIGPYSTILVKSEFTANNDILNRQDGEIPHERTHLTGTSNYDLYLTAFNVSFDHNPTKDQVQRFISYLLA